LQRAELVFQRTQELSPVFRARFGRGGVKFLEFFIRWAFQKHFFPFGRHVLDERRIAKVEEGPVGHGRVVEDAVQDLQLRNALTEVLSNPTESVASVRGKLQRHPAIALAQNPDEKWPATIDLPEAQVQDSIILRLLAGDAPPQVDVIEINAILEQ
jgi:hypothetical protein